VFLLFMLALVTSGSAIGTQLPVATFTRSSSISDVMLSPKGRFLAMHVWIQDHMGLQVVQTESLQATQRVKTPVGNFAWAGDSRLVFENQLAVRGNPQPAETGVVEALEVKSGSLRKLNSVIGFRRRLRHAPNRQTTLVSASILDALPNDPKHVLLTVYPIRAVTTSSAYNTAPDVYKVDIRSGSARRIARTAMRNAVFLADTEGRVRFAIGFDQHFDLKLMYRQSHHQDWLSLPEWQTTGSELLPVGFGEDNQSVYVLANSQGKTQALYRVDLQAQHSSLMLQHPSVDITEVYIDPGTHRVFAVRVDPGKPQIIPCCTDAPLNGLIRQVAEAFPRQTAQITSLTQDARRAIVFVSSDRDPGRYFLLDIPNRQLKFLYAKRPWINPEHMAKRQPIHLTARDGLLLNGYVTLPRNRKKPLPTVVLPHGGPYFVRDYWDFDAEAQLLASRGYAVLQINYRGSTGYGVDFYERGLQQWGAKIQNDITDATRWLIDQGIAAPSRICIMGSSFGGYAALMGAVREPDLYRCSIGISGIYDLNMLFEHGDIQRLWGGEGYLEKAVGNDKADLRSRSPLHHAAAIKAAVMLVHGGQDRRAPVGQATAMREALIAAGNTPLWLLERGEGHGFYAIEHQTRMYTEILDFLAGQIAHGDNKVESDAGATRALGKR